MVKGGQTSVAAAGSLMTDAPDKPLCHVLALAEEANMDNLSGECVSQVTPGNP